MNYSRNDIKKLGSILGVWSHPDDEAWASAGLMKIATQNGQAVAVITATRGGAGETADEYKWPKKDLRSIRAEELSKCLNFIGDVEHYWLDCKDGELKEDDGSDIENEIVKIINEFSPDTIITFEENGITGHDDHKCIHNCTKQAASKSGFNGKILYAVESQEKYIHAGKKLDIEVDFYFNIDTPKLYKEEDCDICIKLEGDVYTCKLNCLRAHESQTNKLFENYPRELEILARTECFIVESRQ